MKLSCKRIVTTVTIVLILMCIVLSVSYREYAKRDASLKSEKAEDKVAVSDEEYGNSYKISENGSSLYAYNSISSQVIEAAKKFIIESGYDSKNISFDFLNSKYTFTHNNQLDMFSPEKLEDEQLYFVEEIYKVEPPICVGYFAINENGDIVESKFLKTEKELEEYNTKPKISLGDAITIAQRGKSNLQPLDVTLFYYNDDKECLCYKVRFYNGEKFYINALTGDIVLGDD